MISWPGKWHSHCSWSPLGNGLVKSARWQTENRTYCWLICSKVYTFFIDIISNETDTWRVSGSQTNGGVTCQRTRVGSHRFQMPPIRWSIFKRSFGGFGRFNCTHFWTCWICIHGKISHLVYGFSSPPLTPDAEEVVNWRVLIVDNDMISRWVTWCSTLQSHYWGEPQVLYCVSIKIQALWVSSLSWKQFSHFVAATS